MAQRDPESPESGTARSEVTRKLTGANTATKASAPLPASALRVRDVMTQQVVTLGAHVAMELPELLKQFRQFQHIPIVGANNRLVGMLTRMDVLDEALGGKDRWVRVRDLMSSPVERISENESLAMAAQVMCRARIHALPVVDEAGLLVGIVSKDDLLSALANQRVSEPGMRQELPVDALMTHEPPTLDSGTPVSRALELFIDERVDSLPVVDDDGRLLGTLSYIDLLRWLREQRMGGSPVEAHPEVPLATH